MSESPEKIPLPKALSAIALSTIFISGLCLLFFFLYQHIRERQRSDAAYQIVAVVQTSPHTEGLKTAYLAELLNLSVDRPKNLYSFNIKDSQQKLLQVPFIKEARIRKIRPGTLHVDYTLRKPIAYLSDYTNTAIDAEGILFPFKPFYTPKKLPEIYTGDDISTEGQVWGAKVAGKGFDLALELLSLAAQFCDDKSALIRIDVSGAFAPSDGQRQIILVLEDRLVRVVEGKSVLGINQRILRLSPDNYTGQLANYIALRSHLRGLDQAEGFRGNGLVQKAKTTVIDLRLSDLAFFHQEQ